MGKMKNKIIEGRLFSSVNNRIFKKKTPVIIKKAARKIDGSLSHRARRAMSEKIKIKDQILFLTYQGDFTCNPRFIAEEVMRRGLPYNLVWMVKKNTDISKFDRRLKLVVRGSKNFYREAAASRIIIDNTHNLMRLGYEKKQGQYLLQTWHGSLGIKRLDGDVVMGKKWKRTQQWSEKNTDYLISNSQFEDNVFESSYWKGVTVLNYGHARNDIFFRSYEENKKTIHKVRSFFGISEDHKVCLYAPTHRDDHNESMAELDYEGIRDALTERFGGEWVILVRFHSRLKGIYEEWIKDVPDYVKDATMYDDINEIILVTDAGITDYSSWIFDYVLLGRPGFILAEDIREFRQSRSFYYPLDETPFPVAEDNVELIEEIKSFDEAVFEEKQKEFLKARGCIEDGYASHRIVDKIEELMHGDK